MKARTTYSILSFVLVISLFSQTAFTKSHPKKGTPNQQSEQQTGELAGQHSEQQQGMRYPEGPVPDMTPGKLCDNPSTYRYPEKIAYCNRDVDPQTKKDIINEYDHVFGFSIGKMNRADFKIDHYFPLCAGGSNDPSNLWPQHKSVYTITDPLEQDICVKMAEGRLKQADAIRLIIEAKNNLEKAPQVLSYVRSL